MSARARLASAVLALFVALFMGFAGPVWAFLPNERLPDPVQEARARALSKELRCLVCQNENIDSSNAELARDLRLIVRERIAAGDTDREVLDYVVARYGDYVLMRPRLKGETLLLWFAPAFLLLAGGGAAVWFIRAQARSRTRPFSAEEEADLSRVLKDDAGSGTG